MVQKIRDEQWTMVQTWDYAMVWTVLLYVNNKDKHEDVTVCKTVFKPVLINESELDLNKHRAAQKPSKGRLRTI